MNHTPGPWEFAPGYDNTDGDLSLGGIIGADGTHIVRVWNDQDNAKADAQFIITACNAHEELVSIVEKLSRLTPSSEGLGGHAPLSAFIQLASDARKALATIEKGA